MNATRLRRAAALGAAGMCVRDHGRLAKFQLLPFFAAKGKERPAKSFAKAQRNVRNAKVGPGVAWYETKNLMAQ